MMIIGVYATLGVFLIIASRNPLHDTAERGHLVGDAPALILVAVILAVLMPRTAQQSGRENLSRPDLTPA
jgi:hypothetical protein